MYYAFEIYDKLLFPYYRSIRQNNPNKTVYITEDNVGVYHKARRLLVPQILE